MSLVQSRPNQTTVALLKGIFDFSGISQRPKSKNYLDVIVMNQESVIIGHESDEGFTDEVFYSMLKKVSVKLDEDAAEAIRLMKAGKLKRFPE